MSDDVDLKATDVAPAPPAMSNAQDLAMSIAAHEQVAGAIVVVLRRDGALDIGCGLVNDESVVAALQPIARVIKEHVEQRWKERHKQIANGMFADDESKN